MKKNSLLLAGTIAVTIFSLSCKNAATLKTAEKAPTINHKIAAASTVTRNPNLNIVYFIPKDLDTLAGYRKRLSDVLLWLQDWYGKEMTRHGYGYKTFGLANNGAGGVKIVTIKANLPKSSYPYTGGYPAVANEVNAYFTRHPADKTSDHSLIIIPRYTVGANGEVLGGGPFYGVGHWCYALDYEQMNLKNLGKNDAIGTEFSKWFGGMAHEMAHALHVPHNFQKVSEDPILGTTLLGYGNYTLGKSPTFLSAADAAILNVSQVLNNNSNTYYGQVTSNINKISINYSNTLASIVVSGKFTSTGHVTSILYYNDPSIGGDSHDYNAVAWESKKIGVDSFRVVMPIADLQQKANGTHYILRIRLVHNNGILAMYEYPYTFSGGVPVFPSLPKYNE